MTTLLNEDTVEQAALEWLHEIDYETRYGPEIAPGEPGAERDSYDEVLLHGRLRRALKRFNTHIPAAARSGAIDDAIRKLERRQSTNLAHNNHAVHTLLTDGVDIEYRENGRIKYDKVWLLDFENWADNDWLAVNQFTVTDVNPATHARTNRRPDIVLFANGIPLGVIELKNPADEEATLEKAYNQLQTYKADIPSLMAYNEALVISDGTEARLATLTAGMEWFKQWRALQDGSLVPPGQLELEVLVKGAFTPHRFLDRLRYFTVFEANGALLSKKTAAYHQYHAVNTAVDATVRAASPGGDRKVGVVWHTQGSGKSLSMLFYAGKLIQQPAMANPTLIVLTDRNDLDDQLFGTFAAGQELLRQEPVQAQSREHLQQLLQVASGGVIFTTIQKFRPEGRESDYPLLSERHNIVFIADEAHRSQYGFDAHLVKGENEAYLAYGFAKYVRDALPNASFIGFTGTPIESDDISTRQVFGGYIDVYDIHRAVEDKATVPIYYEARLAKLKLREEMRPKLDPEFDAITEGEEQEAREKKRSKWSALEAIVGTEERLAQVAADIVAHFELRQEIMEGKGMIIAMSRRIAVDLYDAIIKLRPEWHSDRDEEGVIKVVMTGSAADPENFQPHVRNKRRRKALSERFKDPNDPLKLVIVRDMWLTGFDAPPLHTMYVDKPMRGYTLRDESAADDYFEEDDPIAPINLAVSVMTTKFEVVRNFFRGQHAFDYGAFFDGTPAQRLAVVPAAMEHILTQPEGKKRYMDAVTALSQAFALAMPHDKAVAIRDEVAFFQAVRAGFAKYTPVGAKTQAEMEGAIKQLVSSAVASDEVINIFDAVGLKAPDISILSDRFLAEVQGMPQRNLALELLRKLINDEIKARSRTNAVQARSFEKGLEETIKRYEMRALTTTEVIAELIAMAREMREAVSRGDELGLSEEELAFYDALAENESAVEVMGDEQLAFIAHELMKMIQQNATIDWTVKQSARARIRVMVRRILRKYGYPPDMQEKATETVLQQAELIAADWVS